MKINNSLEPVFDRSSRYTPSKSDKIISWAKSIKKLYWCVHQSGLDRALWILNYVDGTLGGHISRKYGLPFDKDRNPLPWYTYPAIEYLRQYDFSKCDIFEFGSGNSSKFWSVRARTVVSVEIDPHWYDIGNQVLSSAQTLLLRTEANEYVNAIHHYDRQYDVIVIDGKYRYNCAVESLKRIKSGGIIILDNADWHPNTSRLLRENEFTQVDFIGPGPINSYTWCTSIFLGKQVNIPRVGNTITVLGGLPRVANGDNHAV